jgi:hypothetical protein
VCWYSRCSDDKGIWALWYNIVCVGTAVVVTIREFGPYGIILCVGTAVVVTIRAFGPYGIFINSCVITGVIVTMLRHSVPYLCPSFLAAYLLVHTKCHN